MRLVAFFFLFSILSPLRAAEKLEAWSTLFFQYEPTSAPSKSTITLSTGSLIAQLGLSGGGLICVGDAQDRMAAWSFKHRAYAPIAGVAPIDTDLSEILKMEVLGSSEVGSARPPSDTPPKRSLRLGWVTSNRTVKVTFKPSADCESELWGVMRVNYSVTQYAGSLEASWVPSSVSLKLGGVWTPRGGGPAGSAVMLLTMGAFKSVAADSIQVPATQVKVAGQSAVLNGNITGSEAMSYQWFKDGVAVVGGTSSSLVIPALGSVHAGNYRVEARNGFGAVQRSYVTLAVFGFTQQPQGASVLAGAPITISAQAQGGNSPVSYQWYKGAQLVPGATGAVLSIGSATLANAGTYSVKASAGGATLTSNSVQVSVRENVALDVSDNFSTGISSSRWTKYEKSNGVMTVAGTNGHASFLVSGSSTAEQQALLVCNTRTAANADWSVEVRGRNAALFSKDGDSQFQLAVVDSRVLTNGGSADEFRLEFSRGNHSGATKAEFQLETDYGRRAVVPAPAGTTDVRLRIIYQASTQQFQAWYDDTGAGTNWEFMHSCALTEVVPDATANTEFVIAVIANNYYGPITEGQLWADDFRLTQAAVAMPAITAQPANETVIVGGTVTLNIEATGAGLSYQWRKDGVNIAGATGSSYSSASVQSASAGSYTVVVSNAAGSVISQSARLSVTTPVYILPGMILVTGGALPASSELGALTVDTFCIGKTEVTWGEWQTVRTWAVAHGYTDLANVGQGAGDNYPVTHVNWYDCVKWCNARSEKEGKTPVYTVGGAVYKLGQLTPTEVASANGYRLPSEKEWEFAARGGTHTQGYTYSGSNDLNVVGWYYENSGGGVHEVGKKQANELGICDMSGNLCEWSGSWYPGSEGSYRVFRGGLWRSDAVYCSVASRDGLSPEGDDDGLGFRVALGYVPEMIQVTGGTLPASSQLGALPVDTFYVGKNEVTWGVWRAVRTWAVANGYTDLANVGQGVGDNYPVTHVNWYDSVKWCNARSAMEGKTPVYIADGAVYKTGEVTPTEVLSANGYRLPSETEWEFAARGGTKTRGYTYSGSNDLNAVGWYFENAGGAVHEVGKKLANELGIYDMSGNAWEWVGNWHYRDSWGRVTKGGGWSGGNNTFYNFAVADRSYAGNPSLITDAISFRVALSSVP